MAIDWSNEPYARLYKRETDDDLLLSWEAEAVWHKFIKKCDRSGIIESRRGVQGLAAVLRIPLEVLERVLQELIEDGRMRSVPHVGFVAPNYLTANDAPRSDKARQAESRLRRKLDALSVRNDQYGTGNPSHDVTSCHTTSQPVTHISTDQCISDQSLARPASPVADDKALRSKPRKGIPDDWQPRAEEIALAKSLGLDADHEADEFKSYWLGDGRPKKNWDQTFRNRLMAQSKRRPSGLFRENGPSKPPRKLEEL